MAYTPAQLYLGQPGTTDTLLYTVPASTTAMIKQIILTNTATVSKTITLGLDAGAALAASNHLLSATSLGPNSVTVIDMTQVLTTGKTIRALQETATSITVRIAGVTF